MELFPPSIEQKQIVDSLYSGNIVVDAVAGSGKTTTVLHLAKTHLYESFLLLTYNKKLRLETKERVRLNSIENIDVHNYHSFAVKHYDSRCFTDTALKKFLVKPSKIPYNYSVIIVDEAQDMTPLYYSLVCKIVSENLSKPKIVVLGDRFQSIYEFNNADNRFIIFANELFKFNKLPWSELKLSQTFRVPDKITCFINKCVLNQNRLVPFKTCESKPKYLFCDAYGSRPFIEIKNYLKNGYSYEDIFILAPSVRGDKTPIKILANALSHSGIPVYVPISDDERLDEEIIRGKIVFSSFHQIKGLERKVIVIFSFDNGYFIYYNKSESPYNCTNTLYVALTRSLEHMTLIHHYENKFLPFLNTDLISSTCQIETLEELRQNKSISLHILRPFTLGCKPEGLDLPLKNLNQKSTLFDSYQNSKLIDHLIAFCSGDDKKVQIFEISVTDLCKNVPFEVIEKALENITFKTITASSKKSIISIPIKTKQINLYESVSEITGIAIPAYFEYINTGSMQIYKTLKLENITNDNNEDPFLSDDSDDEIKKSKIKFKSKMNFITQLDLSKLDTYKLLELANLYNSKVNKLVHKINQINEYSWLSDENLDESIKRLEKIISPDSKFEVKIAIKNRKELYNRKVKGYIDCIDRTSMWEFKCVKTLDHSHLLQTAIYMYMYYCVIGNIKKEKTLKQINLEDEKKKLKEKINLIENFSDKYLDLIKLKIEESSIDNDNDLVVIMLKNKLTKINNELETELDTGHNFNLYNILTKEHIRLSASMESLEKMMNDLIIYKFFNKIKISDKEFLDKCLDIYNNYIFDN